MGIFAYLSPSSKPASVNDAEKENLQSEPAPSAPNRTETNTNLTSAESVPLPLSPVQASDSAAKSTAPKLPARRFSFRTFSVQPHDRQEHKPALSALQERDKKEHAAAALSKRRLTIPILAHADKQAQESALVVRRLIVGPTSASPSLSLAVAKPQMSKLKSQLMQTKSANKVIAHLRTLPSSDDVNSQSTSTGPIHAVCLAHTDTEEHDLHFHKLTRAETTSVAPTSYFAQMTAASVETMSSVFNEMHVVDLVKSPDLGLGQPGNGNGILAGAVPTAETVINGIEQITPQLMALGYATGRAILPDHTGIHPPTDRMSVLTYWWGLEVVLPPPSLVYLGNAQSVSGAVINFLTALAVVNNGVREILPFVRYISQFIDFEFKSIQAQDMGQGVVCAATWIMPAAMVPRPWDFPPATASENEKSEPTAPEGMKPGSTAPESKQPEPISSNSKKPEPTASDSDKSEPSASIGKVPESNDTPSPGPAPLLPTATLVQP